LNKKPAINTKLSGNCLE